MNHIVQSRRGFVAAGAAGVVAVGALAATQRFASLVGRGTGTVAVVSRSGAQVAEPSGSLDAWTAAIGSAVRITGEQGSVVGRILSVQKGQMGGKRPKSARTDALVIDFETALASAPTGSAIYRIESVLADVRELYLMRGADVLGRAVFTAVLN